MSSADENRVFAFILLVIVIFILVVIHVYSNIIIPQYKMINRLAARDQVVTVVNDVGTNRPIPPYKNINSEIVMPVVATRGVPSSYEQIGILTATKDNKIIPLFGRRLYSNSARWNYYTRTDSFNSVSIPVKHNGRACDEEVGCDEIYTGDVIQIEQLDDAFTATIYKSSQYYYNPWN